VENICRLAFCKAYGVSHRLFESICAELKAGLTNKESACNEMDDQSAIDSEVEPNEIEHSLDVHISQETIAAMECPNTHEAKLLNAWISNYIRYSADIWPNREGVIHIPNLEKKEIWKIYFREVLAEGSRPLTYVRFVELWELMFPHVQKKPLYGVMGHCETCSRLQSMRIKYTDKLRRLRIKQLFAVHRSAYMGERFEYYKRCRAAKDFPEEYLSIIFDGMQQAHSQLPWCAESLTFKPSLNQVC